MKTYTPRFDRDEDFAFNSLTRIMEYKLLSYKRVYERIERFERNFNSPNKVHDLMEAFRNVYANEIEIGRLQNDNL